MNFISLENGIIKTDRVEKAMKAVDRKYFCPNDPYKDNPQRIGALLLSKTVCSIADFLWWKIINSTNLGTTVTLSGLFRLLIAIFILYSELPQP